MWASHIETLKRRLVFIGGFVLDTQTWGIQNTPWYFN